jgi:threonylcarbamoyladenosine tRNA methylthiotransferase MtaB
MRVFLDSLGCRLNQSEMESLARQLARRGCELLPEPSGADISVLNTCAVTHEAERKSRQRARQIHRANPAGEVVLTGCYATLAPAESACLPGVRNVVDNSDKGRLAELLQPNSPAAAGLPNLHPTGRTRAFVKVQDGCDNQCTYCVTTIARGRGISRPLREVIAEIQALEAAGYQEVVLTGVHLGSYGHDNRGPRLPELVNAVLHETNVPRLRLSSLEPWDLEPGFFGLWTADRLCRQLHLPLQSGSATVLQRMGRQTTPDRFRRLAQAALDRIPDLALTTDMIVGFPGETEADFAASLALIEELDFARLHVFRFSPRPGTVAAQMDDRVASTTIQARSQRLRGLAEEKQRAYLARFAGQTMPVLWESTVGRENGPGRWRGHTDTYITVIAESREELQNRITPARLTRVCGDHMEGVVQLGCER